MANTFLVTVGTTAITNWLKYGNGSSETYSLNYEDHIANRPIVSEFNFYTALFRAIRGEIINQLTSGHLSEQTRRLFPAEIMTLAGVKVDNTVNLSIENDTIVLLYSDTLDGQMASAINQLILQTLGFKNIQPHKMKGVHAGKDGFEQLKDKAYFPKLFADHVAGKDLEKDIKVVFSGGYKALIPLLRDFCRDGKVPMYYLYEESFQIVKFENDAIAASYALPARFAFSAK